MSQPMFGKLFGKYFEECPMCGLPHSVSVIRRNMSVCVEREGRPLVASYYEYWYMCENCAKGEESLFATVELAEKNLERARAAVDNIIKSGERG